MHVEVGRYPVWSDTEPCRDFKLFLPSELDRFIAEEIENLVLESGISSYFLDGTYIKYVLFVCRGDVVDIDSWVAAEGKNGMRRDFIVRDYASGEVIARATRCVI
jgi:hypothetical protein